MTNGGRRADQWLDAFRRKVGRPCGKVRFGKMAMEQHRAVAGSQASTVCRYPATPTTTITTNASAALLRARASRHRLGQRTGRPSALRVVRSGRRGDEGRCPSRLRRDVQGGVPYVSATYCAHPPADYNRNASLPLLFRLQSHESCDLNDERRIALYSLARSRRDAALLTAAIQAWQLVSPRSPTSATGPRRLSARHRPSYVVPSSWRISARPPGLVQSDKLASKRT